MTMPGIEKMPSRRKTAVANAIMKRKLLGVRKANAVARKATAREKTLNQIKGISAGKQNAGKLENEARGKKKKKGKKAAC